MPRPIPDNPELIDGWRYYLVALPDDDVAIAAAWDAFSALANYWEWGLEGPETDSDVMAQVWADAMYETMRIRDMGFPDAILDYIDEVETLLRALQNVQKLTPGCCDNIAPVNEDHDYDDSDYPDTPPGTWGDETVADSDDWQELVCGAAHAYVDHLKAMSEQLEELVGLGAVAIGAIAGLLSLGAGAGILLGIAYGTAAGVTSAIIASATVGLFGPVGDDLEDARDEIICAIVGPSGSPEALSDAVENAISATAWSLFYQYVDYSSARNIMLEGNHGSETLPVNRRTDCNCEFNLADFELVNNAHSNAALSGSPTWTQNDDWSWDFDWDRVPQDSNAEQPGLLIQWILNTISCAASSATQISYGIRVTGQYDDPSGNPGSGDFVRRVGTDTTCPDTGAPASPGTAAGPSMSRNEPINILVSDTVAITANRKYLSFGFQVPNIHADEVHLTFTVESLSIT